MPHPPPDLPDDALTACLRTNYRLHGVSLRFLPLGYDPDAFVYEATARDGTAYFVKVRRGPVNLPALRVPHSLVENGIPNILAPLPTATQELWSSLDGYSVVLYPFLHGESAMNVGLSDAQWREFGATLKAIHSGAFASQFRGQLPEETFALPSAPLARRMAARARDGEFVGAARELAALWAENAARIEPLLTRAETQGRQLQARRFEHVLCHADIHAGNILVGADGRIWLVDWDGPLLAPKERDLLFVVGSPIARRVEPREEALFFEGYGPAEVDRMALAYYRYERAIEDIGVVGQVVFEDASKSEEAKMEEIQIFRWLFAPGDIVEAAMEADGAQEG